MRSKLNYDLDQGLLLGHVRDGRSIKIFESEDMAAEFISIVKMYDPQDDFIYVIYPHPTLAGKFRIAIFSPPEEAQTPLSIFKEATGTIIKIHQKKAA